MITQQPPHDLELEATLVGHCMEDIECYDRAASLMQGGAAEVVFFSKFHAQVWGAICGIVTDGQTVEPMAIKRALQKSKIWRDEYQDQIADLYIAASRGRGIDIESSVMHLVGLSIRRQAIIDAVKLQTMAYDMSVDPFSIAGSMQQSMIRLESPVARIQFHSIGEIMLPSLKKLEAKQREMQQSKRLTIGQPTGLTILDYITGGDKPGELTTWAARPGGGKSTVALVGAVAAAEMDDPQAIISLEMDDDMQLYRMLSARSGVQNHTIQQAKLKPEDWAAIYAIVDKLGELPIYLDFSPGLDIIRLEAKIRALARKGVKRIFIDYVQLMDEPAEGQSRRMFDNENAKISRITKRLKQLAGELGISIVLLSQMSREIDKRSGERMPQLSDLRGSGSIEQDSNNVYFLYSPIDYEQVIKGYCTRFYPAMDIQDMQRLTMVVIAKQRNGGKVPVPFWNDRKFCRMVDIRDMDIYRRLGYFETLFGGEDELVTRMGWQSLGVQSTLELELETKENDNGSKDFFPF